MERTRRLALTLIGIACCSCFCGPVTPTPPSITTWDPVGSAEWPAGSLLVEVNPQLSGGAQGSSTMHLFVNVGGNGATSSSGPFRIQAIGKRADGSIVGAGSSLHSAVSGASDSGTSVDAGARDAGSVDAGPLDNATWKDVVLAFSCPPRETGAVVGQQLEFTVTAARESDHQLLGEATVTVVPVCAGSCPCQ